MMRRGRVSHERATNGEVEVGAGAGSINTRNSIERGRGRNTRRIVVVGRGSERGEEDVNLAVHRATARAGCTRRRRGERARQQEEEERRSAGEGNIYIDIQSVVYINR